MSGLMTVEEAAPGDVAAVRALGRDMRDTAEAARQSRNELRTISSSCRQLPWEGLTADAFQVVAEELPLDVEKLATGYEEVAQALLVYGDRLAVLKTRAGEHVRAGKAAIALLLTLRARRASLQASLNAAMWSARSAQGNQVAAATDPSPAGVEARARADREASSAQSRVTQLQGEIAGVDRQIGEQSGILEKAKQGLQDVKDEAREAGRAAARTVRDAADNSFRDRGFAATMASFGEAVGTAWSGPVSLVLKSLLGKDAVKFALSVVKKADNMTDLMAAFVRQQSPVLRKFLSAVRLPVRAVGSIMRIAGAVAWPLTIVTGAWDALTGGGYDGWRGTVTRILGAAGAIGGVVLGVAAFAGTAAIASVVGVAAAPFVLAAAGVAAAAYGLWSAGNAIYDNWDTIKGWGSSVGRGVQRGWTGLTSGVSRAGRGVLDGVASIGRGLATPSMVRGLRVF